MLDLTSIYSLNKKQATGLQIVEVESWTAGSSIKLLSEAQITSLQVDPMITMIKVIGHVVWEKKKYIQAYTLPEYNKIKEYLSSRYQ
tara:strand:- start:312 stop:572 length:261 start_codon:yes stop_codon:yes gene_type:complete